MEEPYKPPFVYVLMPFDDKFDDVYNFGIKEACKAAGAECKRADEESSQEIIISNLYNQIAKADVIVADMTSLKPNVYYEIGYAHALGKRVILLIEKGEHIPFNLNQYPHILYDRQKLTDLKEPLTKKMKQAIDDAATPTVKPKLRVWPERDVVSPSFRERLEDAKEDLFLVGFSFETLFKDRDDALKSALKKGVKVKVLMLHPDALHATAHDEFSSRGMRVKETIEYVVEQYLKPLYDALDKSWKEQLDVRATYYLPRFAARIYDKKRMLLNFYLYESRASINPVIEIRHDHHMEVYNKFHKSLEGLFEYEGGKKGGHPNHKFIENGHWNPLP